MHKRMWAQLWMLQNWAELLYNLCCRGHAHDPLSTDTVHKVYTETGAIVDYNLAQKDEAGCRLLYMQSQAPVMQQKGYDSVFTA